MPLYCKYEVNEILSCSLLGSIVVSVHTLKEDVVSDKRSEGFDPLKIQAESKAAKERSKSVKTKIRKILMALLLPVLIVAGMYAVGGTGDFSKWKQVRKQMGMISDGSRSPAVMNGLVKSIRGIDDVRGNRAPLAGVYCVYALQMLAEGNSGAASKALGILKADFADDMFFSKLWDKGSFTEVCQACAAKSGLVTCTRCNGRGKIPAAGGALKINGRSRAGMKTCMVCHGTGKIKAASSVCSVCGGSGIIISKEAVRNNLKKAIKREKKLVTLKCMQCALSLRPLWEKDK
jgi:hypothetical protein